MPDTVDDFMTRFGGDKSVDDREAARFHDRFVSTAPDDRPFDNTTYHESATEYLGRMPEREFNNAASEAIARAPREERQGLLNGLLGALGGGGGFGGLASRLGLGSTDPDAMSEADAARVMDYTRRERPEVLQKVVEEKPWFVKAMGNPVVIGALTMAAAKLLQKQRRE